MFVRIWCICCAFVVKLKKSINLLIFLFVLTLYLKLWLLWCQAVLWPCLLLPVGSSHAWRLLALLLTASATCLSQHLCHLLVAFGAQVISCLQSNSRQRFLYWGAKSVSHLTHMLKFRPFFVTVKSILFCHRGQRSLVKTDVKVICHICWCWED